MPEAARVAAELKEALSMESVLIEGSKGIFDITVDGKLLYSKKNSEGRFPAVGEVARIIQAQ